VKRGRQVNGGKLPPHVVPFCIAAAALAACLPIAALLLMRASIRLSDADLQMQQVRANADAFEAVLVSR
jgi:Na+(H+)/acetate symporter ActP